VVVTLSFGSRVLFVLNVLNNILFFYVVVVATHTKKNGTTNDETPKFRLCFWKNDDEKEDGKKH